MWDIWGFTLFAANLRQCPPCLEGTNRGQRTVSTCLCSFQEEPPNRSYTLQLGKFCIAVDALKERVGLKSISNLIITHLTPKRMPSLKAFLEERASLGQLSIHPVQPRPAAAQVHAG